MSELKLKSKLNSSCDYRSVDLSEFAIPLEADMERYERDLKNFLKTFAKKEEASNVAADDMVTLSCSSENPKFQKEHLILRIGLGLYSKELEAKLIGMTCGEEKSLTVGQDSVTVSVEKVVREIIPELSDELAAQSGIPDVQTAEDVRTYCRYKQYDRLLEDPADEAFAYLSGKVVEDAVFDLNEDELATAKAAVLRSMDHHSMFGGRAFDEIPEEEFASQLGCSKQEWLEIMTQTGESTLKAAVMGQSLTVLQDEDYEAYIAKLSVALQRPAEEVRKDHPVTNYLIETYCDICMDTFEKYALKKLKEVGEWKHCSSQSS